ncbi:MAG: DUF4404 family protein, partial [Planctomycetota bacterium]
MREQLEETIEQLRSELENADQMDAAEVEELRRALDEISHSLDEPETNSASLAEILSEQTRAFQESHPVLTQTVGRLADMLS